MLDNSFYEVLSILEKISVILGVAFVAIQIWLQTRIARADHDRHKKQSTIEFYNLLSTESYHLYDVIKNDPLDFSTVKSDEKLEESVIRYLGRLERLAVGVAADVYDYKLLFFMTGWYIPKKYNQLKAYINSARIHYSSPNRYKEFERLAKRIKKDYGKRLGIVINKKDRVKQL
jgi:hypothetical protein